MEINFFQFNSIQRNWKKFIKKRNEIPINFNIKSKWIKTYSIELNALKKSVK